MIGDMEFENCHLVGSIKCLEQNHSKFCQLLFCVFLWSCGLPLLAKLDMPRADIIWTSNHLMIFVAVSQVFKTDYIS